MNKNTIYVVLAVLVLAGVVYYFSMNSGTSVVMPGSETATTTMETSTSTASSTTVGTVTTGQPTGSGQTASNIKGYPASWPSDVAKYPNGVVNETAGNNPKSLPNEAGVVFTTKDSVKTVVSFYLANLRANGWTITEDGAGTGSMTTISAKKGKRSFGGYIHTETTGKTEATLGVNLGL